MRGKDFLLILSLLLFWPQPQATAQTPPTDDTACSGERGPFTLSIAELSGGKVYAQLTPACAEGTVLPGDPRCSLGGIACVTEGAACTSGGQHGTCTTHVVADQCRRCDCVVSKSGGSQSSHLLDGAARAIFNQVKFLAGQGQPLSWPRRRTPISSQCAFCAWCWKGDTSRSGPA